MLFINQYSFFGTDIPPFTLHGLLMSSELMLITTVASAFQTSFALRNPESLLLFLRGEIASPSRLFVCLLVCLFVWWNPHFLSLILHHVRINIASSVNLHCVVHKSFCVYHFARWWSPHFQLWMVRSQSDPISFGVAKWGTPMVTRLFQERTHQSSAGVEGETKEGRRAPGSRARATVDAGEEHVICPSRRRVMRPKVPKAKEKL